MKPGDKFKDQCGAVRIVTDVINDGEEVGYRIEGVKMPKGGPTGKHFQAGVAFLAECVALPGA